MTRTSLLVLFALSTGACAVDEDPAFDVTLSGDSKADELGGRRVHWEVGETHDWFAEMNPELSVTVGVRGATLMLLHADVAELKPLRAAGQANFEPTNTITIGLTPTGTNIELAFVLASASGLAQGQLAPFNCAGTQMFKSLAIDFVRGEVKVDGTRTATFAQCGIALDAKDRTMFNASSFAVLAVPWRTTDGSPFKGTYAYHQTVTIR